MFSFVCIKQTYNFIFFSFKLCAVKNLLETRLKLQAQAQRMSQKQDQDQEMGSTLHGCQTFSLEIHPQLFLLLLGPSH